MATTLKSQAVQDPAAQPMTDDQATSDVQSSSDDMPKLLSSELLPTLTPRQQVISMLVAGYISGMIARTKPYSCDVLDPIHLIGLAAPVADAILDQS